MNFRAETALMVLAWALYLFDSLLLLQLNQAVLFRRGRSWVAAFGAHSWTIRGKEPFLPNPLLPHRPMYVLHWGLTQENTSAPGSVRLQERTELHIFMPFVLFSWLCLFVVVPVGLFSPLGVEVTLAGAAAMYLSNGIALLIMVRRRAALGLSGRRCGALALECLTCPPFAVNLVRRLSAVLPVQEDFVAASTRVLRADALPEVHRQCLRRLQAQIDITDETTPQWAALVAARARFTPPEELE